MGLQAETSKCGVYFHFPTKESLFLELLKTTADRLVGKVERSIAPVPLSLIHISEPTRRNQSSRMPSSA